MIPHCQATWCADTSVHVCMQRCSSVIHEMYGWKWADSVSRCVLGVYHWRRVVVVVAVMGEQRCAEEEVSFICIWHTSLLCYSDSTIILITVCLPLTPSTPLPLSHPPPTSVSTDKKDDVSADRFAALSALLFPTEQWKKALCAQVLSSVYKFRNQNDFSAILFDFSFSLFITFIVKVDNCFTFAEKYIFSAWQ